MSDVNRENRAIDWAVSKHRTRHHDYGLVGPRSKAGGVKRRNHFTTTEPTGEAMPRSERETAGLVVNTRPRFLVKRGKRTLAGPFYTRGQAENRAFELGGTVASL